MMYIKTGLFFCFASFFFFISIPASSQNYINETGSHFEIDLFADMDRVFFPDADEGCITVEVCGWEMGKSYSVFGGLSPYPKVVAPRLIKGGDYVDHHRFLQITPSEECVTLEFCYSRERPQQRLFFSYSKDLEEMEATKGGHSREEGIDVEGGISPEELVQDILIGGNCFDVQNIEAIGPPMGMGTFRSGMNSIGIESGVVFSTGNIRNILGPNSSASTGNNMMWGGDPDLEDLLNGVATHDAVGVQFDFIPTSDTVRFRYVFASEEYCEWVGQDFNDVFGFFISGPGIDGPFSNNSENIALIPGTEDFVTINNVNREYNSQYFFDNTPEDQPQGAGANFIDSCGTLLDQDGVAIELIEFDGFTAVFEAVAVVTPCEQYTIKMVVGDAFDGNYDSAVFLEAGSFNAGAGAKLDSRVEGVEGNTIYDDCLTGYFVLNRIGGVNMDEPLVIHMNYSDQSTAVPGVDFIPLPDSIVIPAHQDSIMLPIEILDTYSGGELRLVYELDYFCSCSNPFAELIIAEDPNIERIDAEVDGFISCEFGEATLIGSVETPQLITRVQWEDADGNIMAENDSVIQVGEAGDYYFIGFNDISNCSDTVMVTVQVNQDVPHIAIESPEWITCEIQSVVLDGSGSQTGSEIEYRWTTVDGEIMSGNDSAVAVAGLPGTYVLEVLNTINGCLAEQSVEVLADFEEPVVVIETPDTLNCDNSEVSLDATASQGTGSLVFYWSTSTGNIIGDVTQSTIVVDEPGVYELEVVLDRTGCVATAEVEVLQDLQIPEIILEESIIFPCNRSEIEITAQSDNHGSAVELNWTTENGQISGEADGYEVVVEETGEYTLTLTDLTNGCEIAETITVFRDEPSDIELDLMQPVCPGDLGFISILSVEGGTFPYTYFLEGSDFSEENQNGQFGQLVSGDYQLVIEDELGCRFEMNFEITKPREIAVYLPEYAHVELARTFPIPTEVNFPESEVDFIRWTPNQDLSCEECLRPDAYITGNITYHIYIEDDRGCPAEAEIELISISDPRIFVPNAFSPNFDGINDLLIIHTDQSVEKVVEWRIFDRWGNEFYSAVNFEPNEEDYGWDGTGPDGVEVAEGVYVYLLVIELVNGEQMTLSGDVTLFR